MALTYRTDYSPDGGKEIVERYFHEDRAGAQRHARDLSLKLRTTVYVIAHDGERDVGQRIYTRGFREADDDYPRVDA